VIIVGFVDGATRLSAVKNRVLSAHFNEVSAAYKNSEPLMLLSLSDRFLAIKRAAVCRRSHLFM
jgi:hypothetical protein